MPDQEIRQQVQAPIQTLQMTAQPLDDDQEYDAEIAVELANGGMTIYRKERRHKIWMEVADFETGKATAVKDHQVQVSLGNIWFNYKTISGLIRKS